MKVFATPRKDSKDEGIPVWMSDSKTEYYYDSEPLLCRWLFDDKVFQVRIKGNWWNAQSGDWDFNNNL